MWAACAKLSHLEFLPPIVLAELGVLLLLLYLSNEKSCVRTLRP
jgi:hypothetical protein